MTPREEDIYLYILMFKTVNGFSPTVQEIAAGVNTKSISFINSALQTLRDKGYISYIDKKPRTINILKFDLS